MVLSPGAGRTNAARGAVPCPPSGGTGAGAYHALAGACLLCRLPTLPSVYFPAPYPPVPLPRRGRGRLKVYFAGGSAPGTPALNHLRHLQNLPRKCQAGGRLAPALLALPPLSPAGELSPRLACATCRRPRRGKGREVSQRRRLAGGKGGKLPPCSCALQKNFQKPLTEAAQYDIIAKRCQDSGKGHGGVAQLARATGSYPVGHRFKSGLRYHIGQGSAVPYPSGTALVRGFPPGPLVKRPKTPPFHGGNSSSNLLRVTK